MVAVRRRGLTATAPGAPRRAVDQRGAFVAVCSAALLVACFLPYYRVTAIAGVSLAEPRSFTVVDATFGGWRIVIPVVALIVVGVGVTNSILRVGSRGAPTVVSVLRMMTLVQLGLWILVAIERQVEGTGSVAVSLGATPTVNVTWVAWAAIGVAAVALTGSFASMAKSSRS